MTEGRKAWVMALRSGDYNQLTYILHDGKKGNHCVMGVVFQLFMEKFKLIEWEAYPKKFKEFPKAHFGVNISNLADEKVTELLCEWLGFEDKWAKEEFCEPMIDMNNGGVSFKNLADYIEMKSK